MSDFVFKTFYFNSLRTCCYVLWDASGECIIIDPGCENAGECSRLESFIEKEGLRPLYIANTHAHFDHVMGNAFVQKRWSVPARLHALEADNLRRAASYAGLFGFNMAEGPIDTEFIDEKDSLCFGQTRLQILFCPGHSPGGLSFYSPRENVIFSGDTLFAGSIGRTDLPGGDYKTLLHSIHTKIMPLGPRLKIYPGHGPATDLAAEIGSNPYLSCENLSQ